MSNAARRTPVVLVADDDFLYRQAVAEILLFEGFEVLEAGSFQGALALLQGTTPDVIVSDTIRSPENGVSLLQAVVMDSRWVGIPVVAASANAQTVDQAAAFAAGASGFLSKPFSAMELLAEVHRQLARVGLINGGSGVSGSPLNAS